MGAHNFFDMGKGNVGNYGSTNRGQRLTKKGEKGSIERGDKAICIC
jgi:hypothetical protein